MKHANFMLLVVVATIFASAGVVNGEEFESIVTMKGLPRALLEQGASKKPSNRKLLGLPNALLKQDDSNKVENRKLLGTGTQTIYGYIGGKGWCGKPLKGGKAVPVALGPKYIKGTSPHNKNCGKCVCVTITGVDKQRNPYPPSWAKKYFGKKFKGVVLDQCPECQGDHIDVLSDEPYISKTMSSSAAYTVGTWKVSWKFISCSAKC